MKKIIIVPVVLLSVILMLVLTGCGENPLETTGIAYGYIEDRTNSHAILGARVSIGDRHGFTDSYGKFKFDAPTGEHNIEVSAGGYLSGVVGVARISENQTTNCGTFHLTPSHSEGSTEVVYLADTEPVNGSIGTGQGSLQGVYYYHALGGSVDRWDSSDEVEYNLGRQFTKFRAVLGVSDNSPYADGKVMIQILGDGDVLHQTAQMKLGDVPDLVDLPVDGVLRLKISIVHIQDTPEIYYLIGDPRVIKPL